jgi:hypothetical protein
MSDTITPTVGIQTGNTQIRVEGEIGAPANPPPGQAPGNQLNSVGVSATTLNGDNTVTNFGVKVGTDPTNPSIEFNASFGPRNDGVSTPYTTQSINPINGQPVEMPGIRNVYPQPNGDTTIGAGVMVTGQPQVLQQPTVDNPNAQVILGQTYAGAGAAVNLNNGDAAANLVGGYSVIAPGGSIPGISVGGQLQVDRNGANLTPDVNVYGTNPPPMDAPLDNVRFNTPQTQEQGRAFDPQAALDTLRRGPEYNQALTALQQNGHPLNPAPDSATDRLAVGLALSAQENKAQINGVDFGNTIVNAQGNADRNVFYGGQNNSGLRISEQQAINTPVTDQINQANQQKTPDNTQATPDRQIDQPTVEPRQRM